MKRITTIALALIMWGGSAHSQHWYVRAGLGYAVPQAGQSLDGMGQAYNGRVTNGNTVTKYDIKSASFSAGLNATASIGYDFGKYIGAELGFIAGAANKEYSSTEGNVNIGGVAYNLTTTHRANGLLLLVPTMVLHTDHNLVNMYMRMGPVLPLSNGLLQEQTQNNLPGTGANTVYGFTVEIRNRFSVGGMAAMGTQYMLNDRMSLWGEVSFLSLSSYIKESELTEFTYNGTPASLSYISSPLVRTYSKTASLDSNYTSLPAYTQPFSNFSVSFGICYKLSGGSRKSSSNVERMDNRKRF